ARPDPARDAQGLSHGSMPSRPDAGGLDRKPHAAIRPPGGGAAGDLRDTHLVQVEADAEQGKEPEEYREQRGERTLDKADGYVITGPCHHDADDDVDNEEDADRASEQR